MRRAHAVLERAKDSFTAGDGELAPARHSGRCEVHNQAMSLTVLSEMD